MESKSLRKSISQEELRIINKANNSTNMIKPLPKSKASCKHNSRGGDEEEEEEKDIVEYLWRPSSRAYTCGFCKRQFRSAQALGGHMNVHRRDRAKLRRSPPLEFTHHHDFLGSSSSQPPFKFLKLYDFVSFDDGEEESDNGRCKIWKKVKKFVKKEKNGLLGSSNEIDLELRLGF